MAKEGEVVLTAKLSEDIITIQIHGSPKNRQKIGYPA